MIYIRLIMVFFAMSAFVFLDGASAMGGRQGQPGQKTGKEMTSTVQNSPQMAREALDGMIEAYSLRNAAKFMGFVAEDFAGDKTILDRAVRKDFSLFTNVAIRYTFNNITTDSDGKMLYVSATFNRDHTVIKTGKQATITGTAEFLFRIVDNSAMLFSMKGPLVFGLSDPSVAAGN